MVGWYDPGQLIATGIDVVISQIMGARVDYRLIESFSGDQEIYRYDGQQEFWFDFIADLGDGWDSTYTMASLLAAEELVVGDKRLPRAQCLIMGGDEVYPVASRDQYEERTVAPYTSAFPPDAAGHEAATKHQPGLFVIPGNHDWYDGLVSFMRLFAQQRSFAGWRTQQRRSYYAIRLPHNWWVWGLDYQLDSDIDGPQLKYFEAVAAEMAKTPVANVILVSAEPDWIYGNIYHAKYQKNIAYLQSTVIEKKAQAQLRLAVSGDLHHYRRHEAMDGSGVQLVTAGGGGAFLLGTTGPNPQNARENLRYRRSGTRPWDEIYVGPADSEGNHLPGGREYKLQSEYPDEKTSKRLLLRNFLFPIINPKFGVLTGLLYLVIAWVHGVPLMDVYQKMIERGDPVRTARALAIAMLTSPFGFSIVALVVFGFIAFTDTHSRLYKYLGGGAHALTHLAALFLISAGASKLTRAAFGLARGAVSVRYLLLTAALIFAGGYIAGAIIMGVYLYISHRVFGRHTQEAYSSLRSPDYKQFLRFHLDAAGELHMYCIGVDRVPRRWKRAATTPPEFVPQDNAIPTRLVDVAHISPARR